MTRLSGYVSDTDQLGARFTDHGRRISALERRSGSGGPSGSGVIPSGVVVDYVGTVAPTGWALIQGQTIVDCQTLNPGLWAAAPTAWRSGANLVLPDARGRVSVGYSGAGLFATIGALGGSANSNMPDHSHWNGDHTHTMADHTHVHDHTHSTGNPDANHTHYGPDNAYSYLLHDSAYNTGWCLLTNSTGVAVTYRGGASATGTITNWHTHGTYGASSGTYTSYMNATHGGALNVAYMSTTHGGNIQTSTVIGGATAANTNYQPYIALTKMVKL